jgi:hypothetical protein
MAAPTQAQWARIWVKAWLNEGFKNRLQVNPLEIVADPSVQKEFGFTYDKEKDKLFNLDRINYDGINFRGMSDLDLAEIALNGKLKGVPFVMQNNTWEVDSE